MATNLSLRGSCGEGSSGWRLPSWCAPTVADRPWAPARSLRDLALDLAAGNTPIPGRTRAEGRGTDDSDRPNGLTQELIRLGRCGLPVARRRPFRDGADRTIFEIRCVIGARPPSAIFPPRAQGSPARRRLR